MNRLKILYKLATRSRPHRVEETLVSILRVHDQEDTDYTVLMSIDNDDQSMSDSSLQQNYPKLYQLLKNPRIRVCKGMSRNKIHAINRDVDQFDFDILVNISDDMIITSSSFADLLRNHYKDWGLDVFLHLPDGYANEKLATMSILGKTYYNRFGYIYHPSYQSVYCDNEAMEVAKEMNCYKYLNFHVFKHLHPSNIGTSVMDAQYVVTENPELHKRDQLNYMCRRAKKFSDVKLSILIATISSRKQMFEQLVKDVWYKPLEQGDICEKEVELLFDDDDVANIGIKRQRLLARAQGQFVVFIDDDDTVNINYASILLNAINSHPDVDCFGINGLISVDGKAEKQWMISKQFKNWYEQNGVYYRTPNHISPIRRWIALQNGFPPVQTGEDHAYSMGCLPWLKNEHIIKDKVMYYYKASSTKSSTQGNTNHTDNHPYRPSWR